MRLKSIIYRGIQISLTFFVLYSTAISAEKSIQILIIANAESKPYQQAVQGFKKKLSSKQKTTFTELYLSQIKNKKTAVSAKIESINPHLIYTLGKGSTFLVKHSTTDIPIISTMLLKNTLFKQADNITGVNLSYPIQTRFKWLIKFFPDKSKIAILYNPAENEHAIEMAKKVAQQTGLELLAFPVETPKQLPYALDQLSKNVEIILGIPDNVTMSSKTAKAVLLASFRNKIPFIGLSDNWVKSGALYALSWDYQDLGQQCATQANKVLNGMPIQKIPKEYPRKITYSINTKIADHLNIKFSDALLNNAHKTFK